MKEESALSEQDRSFTGETPAAVKAGPFAFIGRGLSLLLSSPIAVIGLAIVLFWVTVAVFAPLFTRYTPFEQDWRAPNQGPSREHILGTDELGRDLWSRLIYGARVVLVILPISETLWLPGGTAVWGVLVALMAGVVLGLVSGYYGGWIDEIVMRLLDAMMAVPIILLFLLIMSALGQSAVNIVIAMTIVGTPGIARLVRSLTMDIRTREFIRAAETRGESPWHIMFLEILPNARGPIIVDAMLRVGYAIFAMGTLGFLGLGLPPPSPDWGSMVAKGREFIMAGSPWAAMWPSIAIASLVVGLNLFADGIREETMRYQ
jgi:peptide/nickel transport system permease protein